MTDELKVSTRGPLRVRCPRCKAFRPSASIPLKGKGVANARRTYFTKEEDIAWVRRNRVCSGCGLNFKSAECEEALLDELYALRQRLKGMRSKAVATAVLTARGKRSWMSNASADIPHDLAHGLVAGSVWWRHPSGSVVRAPRHADRLEKFRIGWSVEFGANGFAAGHALALARTIASDAMDKLAKGDVVTVEALRLRFAEAVEASVFNHDGTLYPRGSYRMEGRDLVFGVTTIDVQDCERYLLEATGLAEVLATNLDDFTI